MMNEIEKKVFCVLNKTPKLNWFSSRNTDEYILSRKQTMNIRVRLHREPEKKKNVMC